MKVLIDLRACPFDSGNDPPDMQKFVERWSGRWIEVAPPDSRKRLAPSALKHGGVHFEVLEQQFLAELAMIGRHPRGASICEHEIVGN